MEDRSHPSQSECSSSPEPSTSEDAVPSRDEDEDVDDLSLDGSFFLHGEISNPPSPLGGRMVPLAAGHDNEVISSSTGHSYPPPPLSSQTSSGPEESLIDSTVDSSGMSRIPEPPSEEDDLYCQSSSVCVGPHACGPSAPGLRHGSSLPSGDGISTTTSNSGSRSEEGIRKRAFEESNGISSSSSSHPVPSTSSGLTHHHQEEPASLQVAGQAAFSGIPQSFLGPVTSSHSSILESLSGPLSKRLRRLHHLQQQQNPAPTGPEEDALQQPSQQQQRPSSSPSQAEEEPSVDSSGPDDPSSSNSNPSNPEGGGGGEEEPPSYGAFSVTLEPSSLSNLSWNQGGMSRARASLPEDLLFLASEREGGVYAKRDIPEGHVFGPLEGRKTKPFVREEDTILFLIHGGSTEEGDGFGGSRLIDVSDEDQSNWLRFVREASSFQEQNLSLSQQDEELYFTSTKAISPDEELKVWYSEEYAKARKLPLLTPVSSNQENQGSSSSNAIQSNNNINNSNVEPNGNDLEAPEEIREAAWSCFHCQVVCCSPGALQEHLNTAHPSRLIRPRKHKCSSCSKIFRKYYHLRIHFAVFHHARKQQRESCRACGLKYAHPGIPDCKLNIRSCRVCGLQFHRRSTNYLHSLSHSESPRKPQEGVSLSCPDCHVEQTSYHELIQHSTSHGFRTEEKENMTSNAAAASNGGKRDYKCSLCHKTLFSAERLQRHLNVHKHDEESAKPLSCPECGKRFISNSALTYHSKVHSGAKRSYDCPICGEVFDQVIQLKEHVHVHRINNQYTCPHCYKAFSEYALIRKHIRAFHSEKKFSCPHCDKSFPGADKLKAHLVKHSDVREFLCHECGKQYKRKDKLKEHTKRMHSPHVEEEVAINAESQQQQQLPMKMISSVDYRCFIYKCHKCMLGFKRRGMLVNHLANRHPEISIHSVPELNLPILKATRNYYCQYCNKVYKSSSKRKSHILKNHPGLDLPVSVRDKTTQAAHQQQQQQAQIASDPTYSAMVGSITSQPHKCEYCHKQYASKPKLLQHHRKKHMDIIPPPSKKFPQRKPPSSSSSTSSSSTSSSSSSSSGESTPPAMADMVELRVSPAFKAAAQENEEPETYHLSAAGVAFVPFIPKSSTRGESTENNNGFVTLNTAAAAIKGTHALLLEGPSGTSTRSSTLEHLINSSAASSSSWMPST